MYSAGAVRTAPATICRGRHTRNFMQKRSSFPPPFQYLHIQPVFARTYPINITNLLVVFFLYSFCFIASETRAIPAAFPLYTTEQISPPDTINRNHPSLWMMRYFDADFTVFTFSDGDDTGLFPAMKVVSPHAVIENGAVRMSGSIADTFLTGPDYFQRTRYWYKANPAPILHSVIVRAKFEQDPLFLVRGETALLQVDVTMTDSKQPAERVVLSKITIDANLVDIFGWGEWHKFYLQDYVIVDMKEYQNPGTAILIPHQQKEPEATDKKIEFRFHWKGVEGCTVWIDTIVTCDPLGEMLMHSSIVKRDIVRILERYPLQPGLYGETQEPKSADNWLPFLKVRELVNPGHLLGKEWMESAEEKWIQWWRDSEVRGMEGKVIPLLFEKPR